VVGWGFSFSHHRAVGWLFACFASSQAHPLGSFSVRSLARALAPTPSPRPTKNETSTLNERKKKKKKKKKTKKTQSRSDANLCWARDQVRYMLGSGGSKESYVLGYGPSPPQRPHHRASACSPTYKEPCKLMVSEQEEGKKRIWSSFLFLRRAPASVSSFPTTVVRAPALSRGPASAVEHVPLVLSMTESTHHTTHTPHNFRLNPKNNQQKQQQRRRQIIDSPSRPTARAARARRSARAAARTTTSTRRRRRPS